MLTNKERLINNKECAEMLGMTLKEYEYGLKNIKVPSKEVDKKYTFDNTILKKMGLSEDILKKNKYHCD